MLITKLKPKEELISLIKNNVLLIVCQGCREVFLPLDDIASFRQELKNKNTEYTEILTDYLCNHEYTKHRLNIWQDKINSAENIIVFSCGVGVQVISSYTKKTIISGCDTIYVQGFKGLTPTEYDCAQCGNCLLNYTGGICPITACTKSLLNGSCGGAKNGKCEIDPEKECGWEKIYNKLLKNNRIELIKTYQPPRNYKNEDGTIFK